MLKQIEPNGTEESVAQTTLCDRMEMQCNKCYCKWCNNALFNLQHNTVCARRPAEGRLRPGVPGRQHRHER
eukprot:COSAG06_NODE_10876_length_1603_cov_1.551197_2_plen_71_part_00